MRNPNHRQTTPDGRLPQKDKARTDSAHDDPSFLNESSMTNKQF